MARYDASNAECLVFTFKEGLLSPIAHDLKIAVERFSIEVDEEARSVRASFDSESLKVVCAQVNGRDDLKALSEKDKKKIHANITKDVLHTQRYPEVTFHSTNVEPRGDGFLLKGDLTLHGVRRAIEAEISEQEGAWATEVPIYQPNFRIKPYSAAFGALKIKPTVKVRVRLPHEQKAD